MRLSIIIPAYNEEKRIPQMLRDYLVFFHDQKVEFIVVLNGCRDNTRQVVQKLADQNDSIRIIEIVAAVGKGAAVKQGFALANGQYVGFVDADGATEPQEFQKLIDALDQREQEYDGAIASRWKHGSQMIGRNALRKMVSLGFIIFVKLFFWMPFFDTQCGAKLFKREAIKAISPKLSVSNMAFDVELLFRAKRAGLRIIEVPTNWINKDSSAMLGSPVGTMRTAYKMLYTLFKIRFS
jgi:glycosyltransferase involved in cell wall biosynthesis